MIVCSQTPTRLPLGGGGTDVPPYCDYFGGMILAVAIDLCVNVRVRPLRSQEIRIRGVKNEHVKDVSEVQDVLIRTALQYSGISTGLEIETSADVPPGSGMGSSGSFLVGLLNALHAMREIAIESECLAEAACYVEMGLARRPVGFQDQYVAALGGFTQLDIGKARVVEARRLSINHLAAQELKRNALLFFTGAKRPSGPVLALQSRAVANQDRLVVESLHRIKEIGSQIAGVLESGYLTQLGQLFHEHWLAKRIRGGVTNPWFDSLYELARSHGALGGKLIGAGGGGYFLFYTEDDHDVLRDAMSQQGLREVNYQFAEKGSRVVSRTVSEKGRPGLFLDRDGILNEAVMRDNVVGSPRRLQEFEIRPDSRRLVDEAKRLGFLVWIVTNQPDIERCLLDPAVLERMHDQLKATLPIDGIEVCPSADDCNPRRKPHPGMLLEIADRCEVDLARSYIIGDGEKDIQAGRAAGVETILFETSYNSSIHGTADHNCRLLKEILATLRLGEGRMG